MKAKHLRIIFLLLILIGVSVYALGFTVRSPFKDVIFPKLYPEVAASIHPETGEGVVNTHIVYLTNGKVFKANLQKETNTDYYFRENLGHSGYFDQKISKSKVKKLKNLETSLAPITANEIYLKQMIPDLFVYRRENYTFFTDDSYSYIETTVELIEKLQKQLTHRFPKILEKMKKNKRICVVIFKDQDKYTEVAEKIAPGLENSIGFYDDDIETLFICNDPKIRRHLNNPNDIIRHEAAHQIFYAARLHFGFQIDRLWLVEGIAVYSETPSVGQIPREKRDYIKSLAQNKQLTPITTLIKKTGEHVYGDNKTAGRFYDESWAFVYFLMKRHKFGFLNYLEKIQKDPLISFIKGDERLLNEYLRLPLGLIEAEYIDFWKDPK